MVILLVGHIRVRPHYLDQLPVHRLEYRMKQRTEDILSQEQVGFRGGRSTIEQVNNTRNTENIEGMFITTLLTLPTLLIQCVEKRCR